jgi:hypothetical protein
MLIFLPTSTHILNTKQLLVRSNKRQCGHASLPKGCFGLSWPSNLQ